MRPCTLLLALAAADATRWLGGAIRGGSTLTSRKLFATEELAARAYDRAAIHKASTEGGVIVTNLDISEYARDIEKLQRMTRKELLAMIADEKKQAQNRADSVQNDDSDGSNGGSGSGSGTDAPSASRRSNKTFGRQSNRSSASQLTHVGSLPSVRDGSNSPTNQEGGGSHEAADTSSGEKSGFETVKLPPARLAAQEEMSKKSPQPAAVAAGLTVDAYHLLSPEKKAAAEQVAAEWTVAEWAVAEKA